MTNQLPQVIADMVAQLGGPQIFRMAFASMVYDTIELTPDRPQTEGSAGISLKIAHTLTRETSHKATHVVITLGWDDVYTVKMFRAPTAAQNRRGESATLVAEQSMVYADVLRATVEKMTGFILRLF